MERRTLVIVCCLAVAIPGILLMVAMCSEPDPVEASVGELAELDPGTLVAVEGRVGPEGVREGDGFATATLVGSDGSEARVFLGFCPTGLRPGDEVRLVGELVVYKGELEVKVSSEDAVKVLRTCRSPSMGLAQVLASPWAMNGLEPMVLVRVAGSPQATASGHWWCIVEGAEGDDAGAEAVVLLPSGADLKAWAAGSLLELRVSVGYDPSRGLVYLAAVSWTVPG